MSKKIKYVLELTEEEVLALIVVLGPTRGEIGYQIYQALTCAHSNAFKAYEAATSRFPDCMELT